MIATASTTETEYILAIDLGKYNRVICWLQLPERTTAFYTSTPPADLRRERTRLSTSPRHKLDVHPSRVVPSLVTSLARPNRERNDRTL
jgi:hypothetical protein